MSPNLYNAAQYANAEKATRPYARALLQKAYISTSTQPIRLFDLACGTGAVLAELYSAVPKDKWEDVDVLAGDVSEDMLSWVRERGEKEGWNRVECKIVDGNDIGAASLEPTFTHATCTFSLFAMPNALAGMYGCLGEGGFVGVATWTGLPWAPLLNSCIAKMADGPYNPSAEEIMAKLNGGLTWDDPAYVAQRISDAGFVNDQTEGLSVPVPIGDTKSYLETLGMIVQMIKGVWPAEKQDAYVVEVGGILREEVERGGAEAEQVFEGVVGWGWKGQRGA